MKPVKLNGRCSVPWRKILALFFIVATLFPITEHAYARDFFSENHFESNNPTAVIYLRLNEVNRKASKHFRKYFLENGSEKWLRDQDFYVASYGDDLLRNKVYYNSGGIFLYIVKTYGGASLSNDLKSSIQKKFPGYDIKTVMDINDFEKELYFIKIVNSTNIKTLKCLDGVIEVTEDFINGGS